MRTRIAELPAFDGLDISSVIYAKSLIGGEPLRQHAARNTAGHTKPGDHSAHAASRREGLPPAPSFDTGSQKHDAQHSSHAHAATRRAPAHTVTTCTGDDPSVLVERYRLGTISGSPRSPVRRLWTCTGRTSQRDGHMFENAQQASEPGSASSGSAIASQSSLWPSRWQTRPSVGASPRLSPRVTRP